MKSVTGSRLREVRQEMRKAECDKVRNDGGNFGQPLQWDYEMKTNDGGMKENV
jgi:hypothetical protein